MANGHGGYRRPRRPASYSGPGKYSQRTDGSAEYQMRQMVHSITTDDGQKIKVHKPGSSEYTDEYQEYINDKRAVIDPGFDLPTNTEYIGPGSEYFTPFGAPSQYPDQPETDGSPFGPGSFYRPSPVYFDDEDFYRDVNWRPRG